MLDGEASRPFVLAVEKLGYYLGSTIRAPLPWAASLTAFILAGKRLRARMLFASADTCAPGLLSDEIIRAAASIELVHAASLLHDDVVDRCPLRRERATLAVLHGSRSAVLAGDYTFQTALETASVLPPSSRTRMAEVALEVSAGQYREVVRAFDTTTTVDDRLTIMALKTAPVFELAGELGAALAGGSSAQLTALQAFGKSFGMLFQIADDVDDLLASPADLGRPPGTDVQEGVMSLPILLALQTDARNHLLELLSGTRDKNTLTRECRRIVCSSGALSSLEAITARYVDGCARALATLPSSSGSRWLGELARQTLIRIRRHETPVH
jgi:heptaprenyl diphosphate synthase